MANSSPKNIPVYTRNPVVNIRPGEAKNHEKN